MMHQKAEAVWKALNGLVCVYKPAEASCDYVKNKILSNLCYELNNLETRPPQNYLDIVQTGTDISINVRPSYADNVLCVGPRYQPEDFNVVFPSYIGRRVSGVLRINEQVRLSNVIKKSFLPKCYNVKGILGQATTNFHIDEKIIAKAKYDRIKKHIIDQILSSFQAASQKKLLSENLVDLQSQEAYDIVVSGVVRPKEKKNPIIYSVKCIDFQPPNFTLEVNCVNENEVTLMELIHNLGLSLKCYATCTGLQCVRHGCFTIQHALLKKHWKLEHVLENMRQCSSTIKNHLPNNIRQSPILELSKIQT